MVIIRPTHHKTLSTKNLIKQHEVYLKSKKSIHTHIDINKADLYYDNNLHSIVNSLYRINRMVLSCSKRTYWIGLEQILDNNNNRFKIPIIEKRFWDVFRFIFLIWVTLLCREDLQTVQNRHHDKKGWHHNICIRTVSSKRLFSALLNWLHTLQSLTGSVQGQNSDFPVYFFPVRKSTQGKPCFHYRDGFAVYIWFMGRLGNRLGTRCLPCRALDHLGRNQIYQK